MDDLIVLTRQLNLARANVKQLEEKFNALRKQRLNEVTMSKRGDTVTLTLGSRVIKAKKNRLHNRWNVYENNKLIVREYMLSLADLRFDLSQGRI